MDRRSLPRRGLQRPVRRQKPAAPFCLAATVVSTATCMAGCLAKYQARISRKIVAPSFPGGRTSDNGAALRGRCFYEDVFGSITIQPNFRDIPVRRRDTRGRGGARSPPRPRMRIGRLQCPQPDGWNPRTLRQFRPDMTLHFAPRRPPAAKATFDQSKPTCRGTLIAGGAGDGRILDRNVADAAITEVGAGLKATNASFTVQGSQ